MVWEDDAAKAAKNTITILNKTFKKSRGQILKISVQTVDKKVEKENKKAIVTKIKSIEQKENVFKTI